MRPDDTRENCGFRIVNGLRFGRCEPCGAFSGPERNPFRFGISVIGYLIVAPNRQQFHVAVVHDAEFGLERIDDSLQIARIVDAQAQIDGRALDQVDFLSVLAEYRKNIGEPFFQHERKILGTDRNRPDGL